MKKISKILFVALVVMGLGFGLIGCGTTIVSGVVKNGTLNTTLTIGQEIDTSNVVAIFKYSDNNIVEVEAEELSFSEVDTSTSGRKTLTITYNGFSFDVGVNVVTNAEGILIASMQSELLMEYNSNREEKQNKQTEFYVKDEPIYVGDDNAFDFRINASGVNQEGELVLNLANVATKITVEHNDRVLEGADLDAMVEINHENNTFDFSNEAIGKTFKITVEAVDVDPEYETNLTKFSAIVKVVDGFNVYNAKELSVYDNYNADYNLIKESLGLKDVRVNGIVLQDNIKITKDDVAPNLFYTTTHPNYQTAKGLTNLEVADTPIDDAGNGVYHRVFSNGENFNFIGNYFTIDASEFPKMVVEGTNDLKKGVNTESGNFMTSHFSLFYNTDGGETANNSSKLNLKNVYFYGNGARNGDVVNSGSIILMKNTRVNTYVSNTITHNFYIGYFFQKGGVGPMGNTKNGEYVVEKCKGYNSYQCLFYMSGAKHVLIKDSEYKGAGGPAIIADHVEPDKDGKNGWPTTIDIVATTIESIVSGQEPWFAAYGAGKIVQGLAQLDAFFDGTSLPATGKTLIAEREMINEKPVLRMNMMVLMKEKGAKISNTRIAGYTRIFETEEEYEAYYGLNGKEVKKTTYGLDLETDDDLADKAIAGGVVYVQSAKSGGYINQNYAQNYDASIVGTTKAIGIAQALGLKNFNTLPLEQQKSTLKQAISTLNVAYVDGLYNGCVSKGALSAVEGWAEMTLEAKVEAVNAQIDAFENVSYADGYYLNLFANTGMGVLMQLYEV